MKLPGGEARALEIGARFRNQDVDFPSLFECDANYAESGADAAGGQGSGIALRHDLAFARHEIGAVTADGLVGRFLFEMDLLGFRDEALFDLVQVGRLLDEIGETRLHALERPKQVDRGRTSLGDHVADLRKFRTQFFHGFCRRMQNAQGHAHGGRDSDRRGAANDHFPDRAGDFAVVGVGVADFLAGEAALIEHDYAAIGPFDWLGYVHCAGSLRVRALDVAAWSSARPQKRRQDRRTPKYIVAEAMRKTNSANVSGFL